MIKIVRGLESYCRQSVKAGCTPVVDALLKKDPPAQGFGRCSHVGAAMLDILKVCLLPICHLCPDRQ